MKGQIRGALIEYESEFLSYLPNVVLFQFNPEQMTRTQTIPERSARSEGREDDQAGELPVETLGLTVQFSAADALADNWPLARSFGIGPQLAALKRMVEPQNPLGGLVSQAIDLVGAAARGGSEQSSTAPVPRLRYPRTLFLWGPYRILPVAITTLTITEQEYDFMLNPVRAEVELGLSVIRPDRCNADPVGMGAFWYSAGAEEAMAAANLANEVRNVGEILEEFGVRF